eukprot:jgi/Chlat1/8466/Chrsp80S00651
MDDVRAMMSRTSSDSTISKRAIALKEKAGAKDKLAQFLQNDRKVLRFFCIWDDRGSLYGERRPYVLHYFLADDTVEILEINEPNSGRDPFPIFLKRGKLPRSTVAVDALGPGGSDRGTGGAAGQLSEKELHIGTYVRVYNRDFLLHDCDEFTRKYYNVRFGAEIEEFDPIDVSEAPEPIPKNEMPPYNGFGSREDSVQNCISLIPKPPKKDFYKLMANENKILRFTARMLGGDKVSETDQTRRFIVQFFLADDTVMIFEPPLRNSGVVGGKFLERGTLLSPGTASGYKMSDFCAGAHIEAYGRTFLLTDADEYTYNFMEQHTEEGPWPLSDFHNATAKLAAALAGKTEKTDALRKVVVAAAVDGKVSESQLVQAVEATGIDVHFQCLKTIARKFGTKDDATTMTILELVAARKKGMQPEWKLTLADLFTLLESLNKAPQKQQS